MAVTLKCEDVGMDCDFAAWAESEEELLELVEIHARDAHGFGEITPELLEQLKSAIREV